MTTQAVPPTVLDTLQQMRELLSVPQRWTRHSLAKDSRGNEVEPEDVSACRFCLMGALYRVTGSRSDMFPRPPGDPAQEAFTALVDQMPLDEHNRPAIYPAAVNDTQGRLAVLALLDRAIAKEVAR